MAALPLSLVIVCHEMARELPRTLLSLSAAYQRGIARPDYEILVIDNGSRTPPDPRDFLALEANISIANCSKPSPSPVLAINEGLERATGNLVGVWIDGARMASPGLLRSCLAAASHHPLPVIATLNYQLGPERQALSTERGYDRAAEDRLLAGIGWPSDGYRLFEIATPEQSSPTDPLLESNALFMPRKLWRDLGGYDPAFTSPGAGLANPDMLKRAVAHPGTQLIRVTGEGTFHQFHGGLSTGGRERAFDVVKRGAREYLSIRGHPPSPVRETGWIFNARSGEMEVQPGLGSCLEPHKDYPFPIGQGTRQ